MQDKEIKTGTGEGLFYMDRKDSKKLTFEHKPEWRESMNIEW